MHPFWFRWKRFHYDRRSTKTRADSLCLIEQTMSAGPLLATICEFTALSAHHAAIAGTVKNGDALSASSPRAKKPQPRTPIIASRPFEPDLYFVRLAVDVGQNHQIRLNPTPRRWNKLSDPLVGNDGANLFKDPVLCQSRTCNRK